MPFTAQFTSLRSLLVTIKSLSWVQVRRLSTNFYSSSSSHSIFCKFGLMAPILMKFGPNSMKLGVLRCLSPSSTSSGHLRGLQTWSLQPENKNFTLESCLLLCLKRGLTLQPSVVKRERFWMLDVLPQGSWWSCPWP